MTTCRNHPDTPARRNCFLCRISICPACQVRAFHHIFCSSSCINEFEAKENPKSRELPDQLQALDQNLADEVREAGDWITDQNRAQFEKLEDDLDRALTALATMVEGASVASGKELQESAAGIRKELELARRESETGREHAADERKNLHQVILTARDSLLELREHLEKVDTERAELLSQAHEKQAEEIEKLAENLTVQNREIHLSIEEQKAALTKAQQVAEEFRLTWKERTEEAKEELKKSWGELETFSRTEMPALFRGSEAAQAKQLAFTETKLQNETQDLRRELEKKFDASVAELSERLDRQVADRLQTLIDDIASLTVAQRGNWNEVMKAATLGAKEAGEGLRTELRKRLLEEVSALAKQQLTALTNVATDTKQELVSRVKSKLSRWPQRAFYGALAAGVVVALATPFVLLRDQRASKQADLALLEQRMEERDEGMRLWLSEKLDSLEQLAEQEYQAPAVKKKRIVTAAFSRGDTSRQEMAFTFDAGSNSKAAMEILGILRAKKVRSTMFLTGEFIEKFPAIVRRVVADGHEVGNHSMHHDHFVDYKSSRTLFTKEAFLKDLRGVERIFLTTTGKKMAKLWRAPYGEVNKEVLGWATVAGYTHVGWTRNSKQRMSLDTLDWVADRNDPLYRSAKEIVGRIEKFEKKDPNGLNGAIVLMHLGSERHSDQPHKKLPELIDDLNRKGYRGVTVSEVLGSRVVRR